MGEYWKPVNLTKREFVHPHHVGDGLKLGEWWEWEGEPSNSRVRQLIESRWDKTDDVRAVSDYGGRKQLWGSGDAEWPEYNTLEETFAEIEDGLGRPPWAS